MDEPFDQDTQIMVGAEASTTEVAYIVKAVETIHRRYAVKAASPEQAEGRLRRYFADPAMVAPGVVIEDGQGERVRWKIPSEQEPES